MPSIFRGGCCVYTCYRLCVVSVTGLTYQGHINHGSWSVLVSCPTPAPLACLGGCCRQRHSSIGYIAPVKGLRYGVVGYLTYWKSLYWDETQVFHWKTWAHLSIKTVFPRYGDSHVKDKTVPRPSYLQHGIPKLVRWHLYIEMAPISI